MPYLEEDYRLLGLQYGATHAEVKKAYLDLVKAWHPDRVAHNQELSQVAEERLKGINTAYERIDAYFTNSQSTEKHTEPPPQNSSSVTNPPASSISDQQTPEIISQPPPSIPPESCPRLSAKARVQIDRVTGEPVLLYPEGVLMLNPTAAAIIELCDGQRQFREIVATLAERYSAPPEQLAPEVAEYLARLLEKRVIDLNGTEAG